MQLPTVQEWSDTKTPDITNRTGAKGFAVRASFAKKQSGIGGSRTRQQEGTEAVAVQLLLFAKSAGRQRGYIQ